MPRVHHVIKARKDYPEQQIKKGESYFWWKFNYGPKMRSKVRPKPQQLTRSDFWISVYDFQDELSGISDSEELEDIIQRIREFAEEQEEKRSNMPESLQNSDKYSIAENSVNEMEKLIEGMDSYIDAIDNMPDSDDLLNVI